MTQQLQTELKEARLAHLQAMLPLYAESLSRALNVPRQEKEWDTYINGVIETIQDTANEIRLIQKGIDY